MLRTNQEALPCVGVTGKITTAAVSAFQGTWMDTEGNGRLLTGSGGIVYNYRLGDPCMGVAGVNIAPGVSVAGEHDPLVPSRNALSMYGCLGNTAVIVNGEAKGAKGLLTGKLSATRTVFYFDADVLSQLGGDETLLTRCYGTGLRLLDYPEVKAMSLSPLLLEKLGIHEEGGRLVVPVTHRIPSVLVGNGIGMVPFEDAAGIITDDPRDLERYGLAGLRFGDVIIIEDFDSTHGRAYLKGAATVGVVVSSNSPGMGSGPGFTTLLTSKQDRIRGEINGNANIAHYLGVYAEN
ncbi:DUF4438 domain-containing protein [Spirochaetia bacterium]|nr:DUF4438 domain-containing protein [Spirochaetia bacterium]